jgi:ribonuclease HII
MICGCDEAGRGPVIGPMVVAIVCGDSDSFKKIGVKDSKMLSESKREFLLEQIMNIAKSVEYVIVREEEIDRATYKKQLNLLEAVTISSMIKQENEYIVDCPDVNEERFSRLLTELSGNKKIISRHKADIDFPLVSAASIVAKVLREREISKIKEELGDFGSGYPSDTRTVTFLRNYFMKNGRMPPHVRRSWKTIYSITSKLEDF